jgi:hypothetical protein
MALVLKPKHVVVFVNKINIFGHKVVSSASGKYSWKCITHVTPSNVDHYTARW